MCVDCEKHKNEKLPNGGFWNMCPSCNSPFYAVSASSLCEQLGLPDNQEGYDALQACVDEINADFAAAMEGRPSSWKVVDKKKAKKKVKKKK